MVLLNKPPPTARAMDKAVGKTGGRQDATPNRAQPSAKNTTLTNHAAVTELPVLSTVKTMGTTRASQGPAKPYLKIQVRPELYRWCWFVLIRWCRIALTRGFADVAAGWWSLITRLDG